MPSVDQGAELKLAQVLQGFRDTSVQNHQLPHTINSKCFPEHINNRNQILIKVNRQVPKHPIGFYYEGVNF